MKTYEVSILSPNGAMTNYDDVNFLVAPGINGNLGILANHAPTVTALVKGKLLVKISTGEKYFDIDEGVLEVLPDHNVVILTAHVAETLKDKV